MYDYQTLPQLSKALDAKAFPSPTKIFSTLNKAQTNFFNKQMENKNSAVYKAVRAGRIAHHALEMNEAKDEFNQAVLDIFDRDIGIDIDETWAKEMGLVSLKHKYRGKFDGVGVFRGKATVWDYKKTNKLKTPSGIKTYMKQCAAYALAHDEMYGTDIDQIAIFNIGGKTVDDLTTRVFTFNPKETLENDFVQDVRAYYKECE